MGHGAEGIGQRAQDGVDIGHLDGGSAGFEERLRFRLDAKKDRYVKALCSLDDLVIFSNKCSFSHIKWANLPCTSNINNTLRAAAKRESLDSTQAVKP